jgi:hypothetical protein
LGQNFVGHHFVAYVADTILSVGISGLAAMRLSTGFLGSAFLAAHAYSRSG